MKRPLIETPSKAGLFFFLTDRKALVRVVNERLVEPTYLVFRKSTKKPKEGYGCENGHFVEWETWRCTLFSFPVLK